MEGHETSSVRCRKCARSRPREEFSPPLTSAEGFSGETIAWAWTHHPPRVCKDCSNAYKRARTAVARDRAATTVHWASVDEPPLKAWRANKADNGWVGWKRGRPKPRGSLALTAERTAIREQGRTLLKASATQRGPDDWPVHTIWGATQILGTTAVAHCTGLPLKVVKAAQDTHIDGCWTCGPRNPDAPHRVYLFHFPQLEIFKVGITHLSNDTRLNAHRCAGGVLQQLREVPTWRAALDLEQQVLTHTAHKRLRYGRAEFPHGGGTECWADDLVIDLNEFYLPNAPLSSTE